MSPRDWLVVCIGSPAIVAGWWAVALLVMGAMPMLMEGVL